MRPLHFIFFFGILDGIHFVSFGVHALAFGAIMQEAADFRYLSQQVQAGTHYKFQILWGRAGEGQFPCLILLTMRYSYKMLTEFLLLCRLFASFVYPDDFGGGWAVFVMERVYGQTLGDHLLDQFLNEMDDDAWVKFFLAQGCNSIQKTFTYILG